MYLLYVCMYVCTMEKRGVNNALFRALRYHRMGMRPVDYEVHSFPMHELDISAC